jgi:NuA3 HAT complex component NTO1
MIFSAADVDGGGSHAKPGSAPLTDTGRAVINDTLNDEPSAPEQLEQMEPAALKLKGGGPTSLLTLDLPTSPADLSRDKLVSPIKRRPGRPPRRPEAMLNGLGSPPTPKIMPLPAQNPREKLNLPKPSFRKVDTFSLYEQHGLVQVNYVDKTMAHVGYQESEVFLRSERTMIRFIEGSTEDDPDLHIEKIDGEGSATGPTIGRVEYDMDEQDERWLDALNAHRKEEQVEAIKPAIFEITMTQIEKEWHALERRKRCLVLIQ